MDYDCECCQQPIAHEGLCDDCVVAMCGVVTDFAEEDLREHPPERVKDIEDDLTGLAKQVPEEDWQDLPEDLTDNLDHHLYGTPKDEADDE